MNISPRHILCLLNKEEAGIRACLGKHQKIRYPKGAMRITLETDPADTIPWISDQIRQLQPPALRGFPDYAKIGTCFNTTLLEAGPMLKNAIEQEVDPLSHALRLSRCGNYIDFGAMDHVDEGILCSLLRQVKEEILGASVHQHFLS